MYPHSWEHVETPDAGPWSAAALTRRALADLATIAEAMCDHQREPSEMLLVLARQACGWRQQGASLPADLALRTVRALPGLSDYSPSLSLRMTVEALQVQIRSCYALASWLCHHPEQQLAGLIVDAARCLTLTSVMEGRKHAAV